MAKSYIASYLPNARRTENIANNSGTIKALSWNHSRRSAVEGLSKDICCVRPYKQGMNQNGGCDVAFEFS